MRSLSPAAECVDGWLDAALAWMFGVVVGWRGNALSLAPMCTHVFGKCTSTVCCLAWGDNEAGECAGVAADADADDSKTLAGYTVVCCRVIGTCSAGCCRGSVPLAELVLFPCLFHSHATNADLLLVGSKHSAAAWQVWLSVHTSLQGSGLVEAWPRVGLLGSLCVRSGMHSL